MTGSPLTSLRKKLTVISSSAIGDDEIELVSSILPQKFAVSFKTIDSNSLVYTVCSEIRQPTSLYSPLKGETIVVILPDHAPLSSCKNEQNGSVVFAQKNERNLYRYGDLNAERNLDRIGTKKNLLDYLDRITTAKDSFADVSLQNKANIKRKRSYNQLFVVVCAILALLVVLALLLIQCLRHRKRRWKSLRRRKEAEYKVDPTQKTDEIQEKLDPTQEMDESMLAAEPSAETSVESAQTRSPVSFDKNREGSSLFVKAEPARSLTEVLENPVSPNEFIRYLQMLANLAIEWSDNPIKCSVTSDDLPGSLYSTMSLRAPETPDTFEELLHDIKHKIISKITHWQHPRFHAFYPSGPCYSNTLGNFVRHTIATFGQCDDKSLLLEELVFIVVNWVGRALGLPESFLFQGDPRCSRGGGTVVRSTSNAIFYFIMTSKRRKVMQLMELHRKPQSAFEGLMREMGPKLVVYINKDAHPYAKKACSMAMVKCHAIQAKISNNWGLTGSEIEEQIQQDLKQELIPLLVYCTMGTTPSAIVDHIESIGPVAKKSIFNLRVDSSLQNRALFSPP
nr:Pyridoxal phosphate-dependent decarboxylase domain containing protein [Haemonchus contortus]